MSENIQADIFWLLGYLSQIIILVLINHANLTLRYKSSCCHGDYFHCLDSNLIQVREQQI